MKCTVKELKQTSITVLKSEFIGFIFPVESVEEFNEFLSKVKKENNKARHACFAYVIGKNQRGSDDGEPKGTAGIPLLNALIKNNLDNVGVIVVRYFGGTLLGAGRLLRTYLESFETTFKEVRLIEMEEKELHIVESEYDTFNILQNFLKKSNYIIKNKEFNDKIIVSFLTPLNTHIDYETVFLGKVKEIKKEVVIERKEI